MALLGFVKPWLVSIGGSLLSFPILTLTVRSVMRCVDLS